MPKCKNCKEKFTPRFNTTEKYCWEEGCKSVEVQNFFEDKKKAEKKKQNKQKLERMPELYPKKYKSLLQAEINKLSKLIDKKFGYFTCIDCDNKFGKQTDAGHFHSVGSNSTIRWNLHNIHSQDSKCNRYDGGRRLEYYRGLIERYSQKYADYVDTGLQKEYKYVGLTNKEVAEKLAIVRKLNRDFDTFSMMDSIQARNMFNTLIGIYK